MSFSKPNQEKLYPRPLFLPYPEIPIITASAIGDHFVRNEIICIRYVRVWYLHLNSIVYFIFKVSGVSWLLNRHFSLYISNLSLSSQVSKCVSSVFYRPTYNCGFVFVCIYTAVGERGKPHISHTSKLNI